MMSELLPPRSSKDLGRCLTLPAAALCRLIVVIVVICSSVWRASIWWAWLAPQMLWYSMLSRATSWRGTLVAGWIAQGHGRVVVEVSDAPWAGVPVRIRWHKRRWICCKTTCRIVTFIEQNHSVCAPRARLGVRVIRWAIRQLRFEGATIAGLARQLSTTWNTVWSHIESCLRATSDDPARFAGVRVLGVDERRVAPPGPTPPRPAWTHWHRGPLAGRIIPRPALVDLVPGLHQHPRCLPYRQARWRRSRWGTSSRPARHDRSPRAQRRPPLLGPQSFARLAPQAHPMPTRTSPWGPLWGCVPSSSGLYRLFHVPSPSRHSRCSRGIVPLTFGPTLSRSYPSRDTTSTS